MTGALYRADIRAAWCNMAVDVLFLLCAGRARRPSVVRHRVKMVALATQKFVADIAVDALQHCKQRQAQTSSKKTAGKDKRHVLTNLDLQAALKEHGVNTNKVRRNASAASPHLIPGFAGCAVLRCRLC